MENEQEEQQEQSWTLPDSNYLFTNNTFRNVMEKAYKKLLKDKEVAGEWNKDPRALDANLPAPYHYLQQFAIKLSNDIYNMTNYAFIMKFRSLMMKYKYVDIFHLDNDTIADYRVKLIT